MNFYFLYQIRKVLNITLAWMIISMLLTLFSFNMYSLKNGITDQLIAEFWLTIRTDIISSFLSGILGGSILVFIVGDYFKKKPYWYSMVMTLVLFVSVFFITIFAGLWFYESQARPFNYVYTDLLGAVWSRIAHPSMLSTFIIWSIIVIGTQFMSHISDKFGPGVIWKFVTGKYAKPKDEVRIFMFLDIRSSTSIAEKLGNKAYFDLLKNFYADITHDILESRGEIYQYVGDEIVVSWSLKSGAKNLNCLRCFYNIKRTMKRLADRYESRYGVAPQFKAGMHYGPITAGEIGVIKREIVYSGDTLNTASRIQEQCNKHHTDLLISKPLYDLLCQKNKLSAKTLGEIELRGRKEKMMLMEISKV